MIAVWLYLVLACSGSDWGFFGHRLINRVAVYTIPSEMIGWYKPNIDYLSDHAVDPDKRRYASKHEAVRHYIDLDQWGTLPFDHVPRYWDKALALNVELFSISGEDTTFYIQAVPYTLWADSLVDFRSRMKVVRNYYLRQYYEDVATIPCDSAKLLFPEIKCQDQIIYIHDVFSEHGIVPYHLQSMQRRLTNAFKDNNLDQVLRISAEFGHYIGDACVPLHTTKNYNGQLTDQVGIHAFWESRIPELFAVEEFDMIVGSATYIDNPADYYWNLVLGSHKDVDKVLNLEKELSLNYPSDQQFCFEDRLNANIKTQCAEYAKAYHLAMDKMVEDRFRVAVKAVGDAWYSAWIDAGQPMAPVKKDIAQKTREDEELDNAVKGGKSLGREHDN